MFPNGLVAAPDVRPSLQDAKDRDAFVQALVEAAAPLLEAPRVYSVHRDHLRGQVELINGEVQRERMRVLRLPRTARSVACDIAKHGLMHIGPLPQNDPFAELDERGNATVVVLPIKLRDRVACLVTGVLRGGADAALPALQRLGAEAARRLATILLKSRDYSVMFRLPDDLSAEVGSIRGAKTRDELLQALLRAAERYVSHPQILSLHPTEARGQIALENGVWDRTYVRERAIPRSTPSIAWQAADSGLLQVGPVGAADPCLAICGAQRASAAGVVALPVRVLGRTVCLLVGCPSTTPSPRMREQLALWSHEAGRVLSVLIVRGKDDGFDSAPDAPASGRRLVSRLAVVMIAVILAVVAYQYRREIGAGAEAFWDRAMELVDDAVAPVHGPRLGP